MIMVPKTTALPLGYTPKIILKFGPYLENHFKLDS